MDLEQLCSSDIQRERVCVCVRNRQTHAHAHTCAWRTQTPNGDISVRKGSTESRRTKSRRNESLRAQNLFCCTRGLFRGSFVSQTLLRETDARVYTYSVCVCVRYSATPNRHRHPHTSGRKKWRISIQQRYVIGTMNAFWC